MEGNTLIRGARNWALTFILILFLLCENAYACPACVDSGLL